jgi:hypothetical protein
LTHCRDRDPCEDDHERRWAGEDQRQAISAPLAALLTGDQHFGETVHWKNVPFEITADIESDSMPETAPGLSGSGAPAKFVCA